MSIIKNNLQSIFKILKKDLQDCTRLVAKIAFWV